MKFHIVGNGESVDDILKGYDLTLDELKNENKHIRIWNYLIPGTKLKIPVLTESIIEDLNQVEPFIEDYYPKITVEEEQFEIVPEDVIENTLIQEEEIKEDITDVTDNNQIEENITEEILDDKVEQTIIDNNQIKEDITEEILDNKIEQIITDNDSRTRQSNQFVYPYVYPQPYYYRPIIYVIPRK